MMNLDIETKTLHINESREDFHKRLVAERARRHFFSFVTLLKPDWDIPWFHRRLVDEIQAWADAEQPYGLILSLPPGHAKALALGTPIPTPQGWKTMGDLRVGDYVFDENGNPTRVKYVSPIWKDRPCYIVKNDTGEEIIADEDHLWRVRTCGKREVYKDHPTSFVAKTRSKRLMVKAQGALNLPDVDLPLHPYVLGLWLGNGSTASHVISANLLDHEHLRNKIESLGYKTSDLSAPCAFGILGILGTLKRLDVLNNKHVPEEYLWASKSQRLALLQGLMDSDGAVNKEGQCDFSNTNRQLVDSFHQLVVSLGVKASICESRAMLYGVDHGPYWKVLFYMKDCATVPRRAIRSRDAKRTVNHYIEAEKTTSHDTVCITVEAESGMFLAGKHMLPTHNSSYAKLAVAWQLVRDPDHHVAYASYAQTLAEQQVSGLFEILDDEVFVSYFGQFLNQKRVVTDESRGSKRTQDYAEIVGHSGWIKAVGRGAGLTGFRVSLAVVDDLLKDASEARSASVERETREWFTRTLSTRKMVDRPLRMLVLATRWGVGDLSGWLLNEQPDRWVEVRFPALKEGDPSEHDPRSEGEALWESVATREDLLRQKALDPEGFQALYQQSPVAEGGNLFRSEWLTRRWTSLPDREGTWLQSWDLRGGGSSSKGSWAVGQLWFRPSGSSDLYLVDQVRGRWSPSETYDVIRKQNQDNLWSKAKAKLIEKKADGVGALDFLSGEIGGLVGITPKTDKESRARGSVAYFAAQNVVIPMEAHWLTDYISELLSFPASSNDDQVDATSQALDYFTTHKSSGPPKVVSVGSRASGLKNF